MVAAAAQFATDSMTLAPPEFLLAFLALGAFAGLLAGLFGVGGGGVTVPILTTLFIAMRMPEDAAVRMALGTSMAAMVVTSFSSMRTHHRLGNVIPRIVKTMAPTIVVGTFLASFVATRAPVRYIAIFFACFMFYVAFRMFRRSAATAVGPEVSQGRLVGAGLGIGVVSALVSIGGGSLTVPFLHWQRIDMKRAVGTSAAIGLVIAISGSLGYLLNGAMGSGVELAGSLGFVYLPAAVLVGAASFWTAPVGARLATTWPVGVLRNGFACLLVLLSVKMLMLAA